MGGLILAGVLVGYTLVCGGALWAVERAGVDVTVGVAVACVGGFLLLAYLTPYLDKRYPGFRQKPGGYVGKYRRPDGEIVNVARVNGRLMVISETPPGELPRDLGDVNGKELLTWERLATSPGSYQRSAPGA